jgi:hypothetical protein
MSISRSQADIIRAALMKLPGTCRYHGENLQSEMDFRYSGACCTTGEPALLRDQALTMLSALEQAAPDVRVVDQALEIERLKAQLNATIDAQARLHGALITRIEQVAAERDRLSGMYSMHLQSNCGLTSRDDTP